jgi:tetratricopeptide (TPR) repeat protein
LQAAKHHRQSSPPGRPGRAAHAGAPITGRRRFWFRLFAGLGIPLVLLVLVEGVLRLAGVGHPTGFFLEQQRDGRAVLTDNQAFGLRFFPPGLARYPRPFTIPAVKPADTLRIFVLGESAAMGDPDFKFGLPRMLEVLLGERFPDRHFEVVNTAMVAINSHVILPIARECARRQGDLWVIYMGNNEVIGPFGSASVFGAQAPTLPVVRAEIGLKATRLGELLDAGLRLARWGNRPLPEWGGMEMMANQKVRFDSPATTRVYRHFERNLTDILATGAQAGVPILLCTVPTNLRDCPPFASLHRPGLTAAELAEWQAAYDAGIAAEAQGGYAEALRVYEKADGIDGTFAELAFRQGRCRLALGRSGEAARDFARARDFDALQFRADGRINGIIRQAAGAFGARGVRLLDAEALFATNSPPGGPGAEFFYEHVHLTPEGNYLLARAVAAGVGRTLSLSEKGPWLSQAECLQALGFTEWNRLEALGVILERMDGPPFTQQVGHAAQLAAVRAAKERHRLASKPVQVRQEVRQVAQAVAHRPEDTDLRWNLAALLEIAGEVAGSEEQWRTLIRLQPQAALPCFNLAKLLEGAGRGAESLPLYRECLRINPDYFPARLALGRLCLRSGLLPEAVQQLRQAVGQKPRAVEPRVALAQALAQTQRMTAAADQWREVLRLDPDNATAREQLRGLNPPH